MTNALAKMPLTLIMIYIIFYLLIFLVNSGSTAGVIHGRYTEGIKRYHLAVPHKATPEGEFHSFHLPHFHDYDSKQFMKRKKRDATDPDAVHYGISVENELHHVELWPDRDFLHPNALLEKRDPTIPVHERDVRSLKNHKMCYYHGKVRGKPNSKAALSTCDGLTGYIAVNGKMHFIEPVHLHTPNSKGHHLHVVYPPNLEPTERFCGVKNSPEVWDEAIKKRIMEEYQNGNNIFKRESTFEVVPKWMEVMVVCDKRMVLKHKGVRDINQWVLTIMSVMRSFFSEESMTGVLVPVLVRIVLLEKEEEEIDLEIQQNCDKTLYSFCDWVAKLNVPDESHPNHFDLAILLSDWDFCDSETCTTQGLAFTGGGCSTKFQNCQLNEDKGVMTSIIVTHEEGHLVGMGHDSMPPNPCAANDTADDSWYIMSPTAYIYTIRWSPCSTAAMRALAEAHLLDCFNDEPTNTEYQLDDTLPGVLYNYSEQCLMMLREENGTVTSCVKPNKVTCTKMKCRTWEGCFGYHLDWADGTPCGDNKWCFHQKCIDKGTRPEAVDGGWGEWGDWSTCSKTCGRGVQFKERLCDNPKPKNHGKYCLGQTKEFRICNPQECPKDGPSFRQRECERLFPATKYVVEKGFTNKDIIGAIFNPAGPCQAWCNIRSKGRFKVAWVIGDGAKCEIGNPMMICVSGGCREIPCDNKFEGSTALLDQCGICNGDGTMCKVVEGKASMEGPRDYWMVATIPAGAKSVVIKKETFSNNIIALGAADNKTVTFNSNFKSNPPNVYPLTPEGRQFLLYSRVLVNDEMTEEIKIDWAKEDIGIYIGHRNDFKKDKAVLEWTWVEPTDAPTHEPTYHWEITDYEECSAQCGGGIQEPKITCFEMVSGKVSDDFCENQDKPNEIPKKCNEHPCEPEWKVGEWGRCRACKKKGGVRIREVQCSRPNPNKNADDILMEDSECKGVKPGTVELCVTEKKCGSRKRKATYVPAKFQDSVWEQMHKLHLVEKRGATKPRNYLKGQAPSSTSKTTPFTWIPPPLGTKLGQIAIDVLEDKDVSPVIKEVEKVMNVTESGGENKFAGPQEDTVVVTGVTQLQKAKHHKKYNTTKSSKRKNVTTTIGTSNPKSKPKKT